RISGRHDIVELLLSRSPSTSDHLHFIPSIICIMPNRRSRTIVLRLRFPFDIYRYPLPPLKIIRSSELHIVTGQTHVRGEEGQRRTTGNGLPCKKWTKPTIHKLPLQKMDHPNSIILPPEKKLWTKHQIAVLYM